jgi:hypothetical protein
MEPAARRSDCSPNANENHVGIGGRAMTEPCPALGFFVSIELAPESSARVREQFRDYWLTFLTGRGLYAMSAGADGWKWAVGSEASQASELDCEAARRWLAARPEVRQAKVGSIEDLNESA